MPEFDPSAHADTAKGTAEPADGEIASTGHGVLSRLAAAMRSDLDGVTDRATARILRSIGAYEAGTEVPRDDLWWSVRRNVEVVVHAVETGTPPAGEDLALRRELGVRRARQGLPLLDLMRAFRLGYLELWEVLFELATTQGQAAVTALAGDAALVWNTMDQVSSAVEEGYREHQAASGQDARRRALALLTALREERLPEARALLQELGRDPSDAFEVAAIARGVATVRPAFDATTGAISVEQADHVVILLPARPAPPGATAAPGELAPGQLGHLEQLGQLGPDHPALRDASHIGIGAGPVDLPDVPGALREAEAALVAAEALGESCISHDERWFDCLVVASPAALPRRVRALAGALGQDEDLRETVAAVLRHDGNVSRAAGDLHLHPNGVSYRLRRMAETLDVDPRTAVGALESRAALTLARSHASSVVSTGV